MVFGQQRTGAGEAHEVAQADAVDGLLTIPALAGVHAAGVYNPCAEQQAVEKDRSQRRNTPTEEGTHSASVQRHNILAEQCKCAADARLLDSTKLRWGAGAHGSLSMSGLAKSRSTHAAAIASVKSTQYASRAERRMTSLLAKVQAWQAQVAAHDASAEPTHENANMAPRAQSRRATGCQRLLAGAGGATGSGCQVGSRLLVL